MDITGFAQKWLKLKDPLILDVYQGYLIAGKSGRLRSDGKCFWINKVNIEGLLGVAKIIAIESGLRALVSLVPGGSFVYRMLEDQLGHPPKHNLIIDPSYYTVKYGVIKVDPKSQKNVIDNVAVGVETIAKKVTQTGSLLQKTLLGKRNETNNTSDDKDVVLGFAWISFVDIVTQIRNDMIEKQLARESSNKKRIVKKGISNLAPPIIASFKTTDEIKAIEFVNYLRKIGFSIEELKSPLALTNN